jgi:hypothetical protein
MCHARFMHLTIGENSRAVLLRRFETLLETDRNMGEEVRKRFGGFKLLPNRLAFIAGIPARISLL